MKEKKKRGISPSEALERAFTEKGNKKKILTKKK